MHRNRDAIRILIADPHPIVRDSLRVLLEADKRYRVVGGAGDAAEVVRLTLQLKPHILLLDLETPYHPVLEALREIARWSGKVRVIVLATAIEKDQIFEALHLGARGILSKDSTTPLLHKSIRTVMAGQYWLGRECVSDVVRALCDLPRRANGETRGKTLELTPRELEIVTTIVAGYTNKEIAQKFSLSEQTVKHHLTNIFDKVGVSNRLELALFAVNHRFRGDG